MPRRTLRSVFAAPLLAIARYSWPAMSLAETAKVNGLIKSRSGATFVLQTADTSKLVVLLTDDTKVGQVKGMLKVRKESMSMAALIPGLPVQVEGDYDANKQLVAKSVKFKGDDLQQAKSIQAGLWETKARTEQQQEELNKQSKALEAQQAQLTEGQKKIEANKVAIATAIQRFGQLDDYYILDEVTVYFANGKSGVDGKYKTQLMELAGKAKSVDSYMIQVVGFASSVGHPSVNQKLSEERAHNVAIVLSQDGHVPLTNMLAPGGMGESRPVGNQSSAEGEAENRRVVVRILQNKGIAGVTRSGA